MTLFQMILLGIAILLAIFFGLLIGSYLLLRRREKNEDLYLPDYLEKAPKPTSYQILGCSPLTPINGIQWQDMMAKMANRLESHQVKSIILIHGTFMGDDPIDVFRLIPFLPSFLKRPIKWGLRIYRKALFGDQAYFSDEYASIMKKGLKSINIVNYFWNSSNHHSGRLIGAIGLLKQLYELGEPRVLILGHSHAGQCLALLTKLLKNELPTHILKELAPNDDVPKYVSQVKEMKLDLVTYGMPPRYRFTLTPNIKLLHIINHRTQSHLAGHLSGLFSTKDGDYIQQFGIAGSDSFSARPKEFKLNRELNQYLDSGPNFKLWKNNILKRKRIPEDGMTYLIDYGDNGFFLKTILGHGIYTHRNEMLKNLKFIANFFY